MHRNLVSPDRHTRRLAKHALVTQVGKPCDACTWEKFWTIYDSADEYSGHLFKSVFSGTVNLRWCQQDRSDRCLSPELVSLILERVLTHENDHVVKFAVTEMGDKEGFQNFLIEKKILCMSSFLKALEESPGLLVKKADSDKIVRLIASCLKGSCFDSQTFLLHTLSEAKLFYPIIHYYLTSIASVRKSLTIRFDQDLVRWTKTFILSRIGAFPAVLRPSLVRLIGEIFVLNSDIAIELVQQDENVISSFFSLVPFLDFANVSPSANLVEISREFFFSCVFSDSTLHSFDSIKGISILIGFSDSEVNQYIIDAVLEIENRNYVSKIFEGNVLFSAIAFSNGFTDKSVLSRLIRWDDPQLVPAIERLLFESKGCIPTRGVQELHFHANQLMEFMQKKNIPDKEKFDLVVSLIFLCYATNLSQLNRPKDLFTTLFAFTADRVSPDFSLPMSFSSNLFIRMDSRDKLHDEFFRFKFMLLKRLVDFRLIGFSAIVSSEDLLDHYKASASSFMKEINLFSISMLENGLVDSTNEFIVKFCDICDEFLGGQVNSGPSIVTTLQVAFFNPIILTKDLIESRRELTKKLLKIAQDNNPLIGRHFVPIFISFFSRIQQNPFSETLIDVLCDLIMHKEGFDETHVEGIEFGRNQKNSELQTISAEIEASCAYTRISVLVYLRNLENSQLVDKTAVKLIDRISNAQNEIIRKKSPQTPLPFTEFHRTQLRIYQALCYLAPSISEKCFKSSIESILFGPLLQWSNQPDARDYLETLAIYFIDRFRLGLDPLISVLKQYNLSSQSLASFIVIGGYVLTIRKLDLTERRHLALALLPFLSSNVSYIRGVSQRWLQNANELDLLEELDLKNSMICNFLHFMNENKESIQMRNKLTPVFAFWDPIQAINSGEILSLCSSGGAAMFKNSEIVPSQVFMDAIRDGVHEAMKDNWFFTRDFDTVISDYMSTLKSGTLNDVKSDELITNSQRKYVPQIGSLFPGLEMSSQSRRKTTQLIVVTTLVDKTTNIAGLCRSAEVFGAQTLVVPSMAVLRESQFSSMSVTAEQWIHVEEVSEPRLAGYLGEMKNSGFTVVCLEQTHDSVEIQNYIFPEKCCLVLGNEKSGVPVQFLQHMDVCVEIPQRGVIRSLNVHVSGAIAMWQYNQSR